MIYAFTGAQGTGKTTATFEMAARLSKDFPGETVGVVVDVERRCPYPINRDATEAAQEWIFYNQLSSEICALSQYDRVVTDRTIMDVIAYTYLAGFKKMADQMLHQARKHLCRYVIIHFLMAASHGWNVADGRRDTDPVFRQQVEDVLLSLYQRAGVRGQQRYIES